MKRVLIIGSDGYIGYALTNHLLEKGFSVEGIDNFSRRHLADSLTPIHSPGTREHYLLRKFRTYLGTHDLDIAELENYHKLTRILLNFSPDAIVHLGEQPSAPYSMANIYKAHLTQYNNVLGTLNLLFAIKSSCPEAHLIKLGTMGEYGTPECDIPEGRIPKICIKKDCIGHEIDSYSPNQQIDDPTCPMSNLLFPRTPGSFYHASKVHDTFNIEFACRNWHLTSTDIMQGVVFGIGTEEYLTRFDYDESFGTAINRFCAQAICNFPLTVYGKGQQTRGFLPLKDSLQCLTIVIENPPETGTYRTLNQFENIYTINSLAQMVIEGAKANDIAATIDSIPNPRKEAEEHYYNPAHQELFNLGYKPTTNIQSEINQLIFNLLPYKERINPSTIYPEILWR